MKRNGGGFLRGWSPSLASDDVSLSAVLSHFVDYAGSITHLATTTFLPKFFVWCGVVSSISTTAHTASGTYLSAYCEHAVFCCTPVIAGDTGFWSSSSVFTDNNVTLLHVVLKRVLLGFSFHGLLEKLTAVDDSFALGQAFPDSNIFAHTHRKREPRSNPHIIWRRRTLQISVLIRAYMYCSGSSQAQHS